MTRDAGLTANFHEADFLTSEPPVPFDWVFEHTLFCAIQPDQRDAYVRAVERWLKPGGHFLAIHYMVTDDEGPPFSVTQDELLRRFSPSFDLLEEWEPRSYPNRTGRERMLLWRHNPRGR
jgi:hypothetical protein